MNEQQFKQLIEKSEVKTSENFTESLMSNIEQEIQPKTSIQPWSLYQIAIGFMVVSILSGYLVYKISEVFSFNSKIAVPFVWSIVLLFGLSYVLSLKNDHPMVPRKDQNYSI